MWLGGDSGVSNINAERPQFTIVITDGVPSPDANPCDLLPVYTSAGIEFIVIAIADANDDLSGEGKKMISFYLFVK